MSWPAHVLRGQASLSFPLACKQAIDEAKKRAVSQRVDYDMFKNMVLTAHLKPFNVPTAKQEGVGRACRPGALRHDRGACVLPLPAA